MKQCCTCKQTKSASDFYKSSKHIDGLQRQCKLCRKNAEKPHLSAIRAKTYRENNLEKCKSISKAWREKNANYSIEYYYKNKELWLKRTARYRRDKYREDEAYRIQQLLSVQVWYYLSGRSKKGRTMDLLGYTVEDFVLAKGNGEIDQQIDHKIPITWFQEDTPVSLIWHLDNLQWLDKTINQSKGNRYADAVTEEYYLLVAPYLKSNIFI